MSTAKKVIAAAKAEVGYREGKTNGRNNNRQKFSKNVPGLEWSDGQPWCATFVAWCARKAGAADLYPVTASCDVAGKWFKDRGRWSAYPAVGAQAFFGFPHDLNHTGIVYKFDANYIWTIEGNTNSNGSREGDGVYLKKRARRSANVIGYGYPRFAEGIDSADPAYAKEKPVTKTATKKDKDQPLRAAILNAEKAALAAAKEARKVGRVPLAKRFEKRARIWTKRRVALRPKAKK